MEDQNANTWMWYSESGTLRKWSYWQWWNMNTLYNLKEFDSKDQNDYMCE